MKKVKSVNRALCIAFAILSLTVSCAHQPAASLTESVKPPTIGKPLPQISLSTPEGSSIRTYLGLSNATSESFILGEIEYNILLIEIFSMYCPLCQREAPTVNQLYKKIRADQKLSGKIKMIGIGVGNSAFEVGVFKKKYGVEFPLFADSNLKIHKKLGQVRTPYFIAICNQGEMKNRIVISKLGGIGDPHNFLKSMSELADCR